MYPLPYITSLVSSEADGLSVLLFLIIYFVGIVDLYLVHKYNKYTLNFISKNNLGLPLSLMSVYIVWPYIVN